MEPWVELTEETWERLLVSLLNAANYLIKTKEFMQRPFTDAQFEDKLVVPLLDTLFQCYLRSATRMTLWEELRDKITSWIHAKPAVIVWRRKLLALTSELLDILSDDAHVSRTTPAATRPRNRKASVPQRHADGHVGQGVPATTGSPIGRPGPPDLHHHRSHSDAAVLALDAEHGARSNQHKSGSPIPEQTGDVSPRSPLSPTSPRTGLGVVSDITVQDVDTATLLLESGNVFSGGASGQLTRLDRFNEAFRIWLHFVRVLGNPNAIEDPAVRELALEGLVGSLNIFLDAVHRSPVSAKAKLKAQVAAAGTSSSGPDQEAFSSALFSVAVTGGYSLSGQAGNFSVADRSLLPHGDTLLKVYGAWLFDACMSSENHPEAVSARVLAYGALCRVFCTRCSQPYDDVFLCSFYQLLHQALASCNKDATAPGARDSISVSASVSPAAQFPARGGSESISLIKV